MKWTNHEGAEWLVADRDPHAQVIAGVTVAGGLLSQPAEQPGVAALTAAWLVGELSRPMEAVDRAAGPRPRATHQVTATHATFALAGTEEAVAAGLELFDRLVAIGPTEITSELRDRARLIPNVLNPWAVHLSVRWGPATITRAALPPLALDVLDAASVVDHLRGWYGPSQRVYWSNEPRLPALVELRQLGGQPRGLPSWTAAVRLGEPGCVLLRDGRELGSVVAPGTPAGEIAMVLVFDALRRRLVELEPLVAGLAGDAIPLHGRLVLLGLVLTAPADRPGPTLLAAAETLTGLAADPGPAGLLARTRDELAAAREDLSGDPDELTVLARRRLLYGDRRGPAQWAAELLEVGTAEIAAAVRNIAPTALLAVPPGLTPLPYPLVEAVRPGRAVGIRYGPRYGGGAQIRAAADRLTVTTAGPSGSGRRWLATASVRYADVALRVDAGDQTTVLIDGRLDAVPVTWPLVRRQARLRAAVDAATAGVPVLRMPPDPSVSARVARRRRRGRRRIALRAGGLALVAGVLSLQLVLAARDRHQPVVADVVAAEVRLGNGTVLAVSGRAEHRPAALSVLVRFCAGDPEPATGRNSTDPRRFTLLVTAPGGRDPVAPRAAAARSTLPAADSPAGTCTTGRLDFPLEPTDRQPFRLRYQNGAGDRITWLLPNPARIPD